MGRALASSIRGTHQPEATKSGDASRERRESNPPLLTSSSKLALLLAAAGPVVVVGSLLHSHKPTTKASLGALSSIGQLAVTHLTSFLSPPLQSLDPVEKSYLINTIFAKFIPHPLIFLSADFERFLSGILS
jgi:hypothetical protein